MSVIRPPASSPLFRAQTAPPGPPPVASPLRSSRSDFFRAVLDAAPASADAVPTGESDRARTGSAGLASRHERPGALLDIRV